MLSACEPGRGRAPDPGALTVMLAEGPRSMDPGDHTATLTATVLAPMYEGLVRLTGRGIEPLLATGWSQDEGGLAWTFTLRPGVRFHDGAVLDAPAVAASFRRLIDPASALAASGKFAPVIGAVEALDQRTVRFRLRKPYADFLTLLASNQASVVSPNAAAGAGGLARTADGTGPFRFVAWRPGVSVTEARNPAYWGPSPALRTLRWLSSAEPSVLFMALRTGDADVAAPLSPVFAARVAKDPALALLRQPGHAFFWIALNTLLPPLGDPRVRRALGYATDRPALAAALLGGFGRPATGPLPATTPYAARDPDAERHDPAEARRLLAEAGCARGLRIALAVQDSDAPLAEALQAMWAKVGVTLEVRRLEGGIYAATAFEGPAAKAAEGLGGVIASWSSGVVPELQLRPLFARASRAPVGANLGFYDDGDVDRLLDMAEATQVAAERARLYAAVQERIVEASPDVLIFTRDDLVGVRKGIGGVTVTADGVIDVTRAARS